MCLIGYSDTEKPDDLFKEALQMHDLDHRNVMSLVGVYFIKSDPCDAIYGEWESSDSLEKRRKLSYCVRDSN